MSGRLCQISHLHNRGCGTGQDELLGPSWCGVVWWVYHKKSVKCFTPPARFSRGGRSGKPWTVGPLMLVVSWPRRLVKKHRPMAPLRERRSRRLLLPYCRMFRARNFILEQAAFLLNDNLTITSSPMLPPSCSDLQECQGSQRKPLARLASFGITMSLGGVQMICRIGVLDGKPESRKRHPTGQRRSRHATQAERSAQICQRDRFRVGTGLAAFLCRGRGWGSCHARNLLLAN